MQEYREWRYSARIVINNGVTIECHLSFYRRVPGRDWYDEARYDSHERKRGQRMELPHFHAKLHGNLKIPSQAEADLKEIIDNTEISITRLKLESTRFERPQGE